MGKSYRKYVVLLGAMMVNSVLSVSLYFSNVSTYVYSLHYATRKPGTFDIDPSWMYPMYLLSSSVGVFMLDFLRRRIGLRLTSLLGIAFFMTGFILSYFSVSKSIWAFTLTFMVVGGIGNGLSGTCGVVYVSRWFKSKMGSAIGIHKGSSSIGGVVMNLVVTSYINPENLSPDKIKGELHLFSQPEIINRLPSSLLVMGAICAVFQITGFCLLRDPPDDLPVEISSLLEDSKSKAVETKGCPSENGSQSCTKLHSQSIAISHPSVTPSSSLTNFKDGKKQNGHLPSYKTLPTLKVDGDERELPPSFTPTQVLKSHVYYIMESAVLSIALGLITVGSYSKLFGQTVIKDDEFLAFMGSTVSFCDVIFVVGAGSLVDLIGLKNTVVAHLACSSFFLAVWYFTVRLNRWLFLVWTVVLYGVHFNQYVLFSISSLKLFGQTNFATNLGLIQIASLVVYLGGPPLMAFCLSALGWFWLFFISATLSCVALLLVLWRMPRTRG